MRNKIITFFAALFFSSTISAQTDTTKVNSVITYFNLLTAGGLLGKKGNGSTLSVSSIHGIRINRTAIGLGLGYDAYPDWRTLPIIASIAFDFRTNETQNALFLQLNAGYSKIWNPLINDRQTSVWDERGRFVSPTIGYRVKSGTWRLYMMAGYKFCRVKYRATYPWWGGQSPVLHTQQDMERVLVQIGFGIN